MAEKKNKRGQGEWSYTQRKDKLWTARRQFGKKSNGKPNIVAFYGKSITEVRRKAKEYEEKLATHQSTDLCKTVLCEYMENWLYSVKLNSVKSTTFDTLVDSLKRIRGHEIGNVQLCNLSSKICQDFINYLTTEKEYSLATIAKTYNTLNAALKYAVANDHLYKNPMATVKLPSPDKVMTPTKEIDFFTPDEMIVLKAECLKTFKTGVPIYGYGDVIILLAYTGMRIGECLGLCWSDYNAEKKTLKIDNTIATVTDRDENSPKKTKITNTSTKTYKSTRTIPLSQTAIATLERIKARSNFTKPNDFIVCTRNGKVADANNIRRCLSHILEKCNFKNGEPDERSLHSLRHTFVSSLLAKKVDIKIISNLVGHRKVSTTYDIYAHLISEQVEESVNLLDDDNVE